MASVTVGGRLTTEGKEKGVAIRTDTTNSQSHAQKQAIVQQEPDGGGAMFTSSNPSMSSHQKPEV
jgi:hypothetical protein